MSNINILVEAKKEYTNQLQKLLRPRIYEGFKSIYEDIINISFKELEQNKIQTSSLIKTFQKMLKEIPQWNQEMINNEYNRILKISNCDYFENLIEAVFIANIKILTSVQINNNSKNININIPQSSHFMHKCYIKCANEIYKNPYIFDISKNLTPKEKHNNLREILLLIDNSINNAISDLLPIGDILKQGLTKNNIIDNKKKEDSKIELEFDKIENQFLQNIQQDIQQNIQQDIQQDIIQQDIILQNIQQDIIQQDIQQDIIKQDIIQQDILRDNEIDSEEDSKINSEEDIKGNIEEDIEGNNKEN
jgi:hypothetical protein